MMKNPSLAKGYVHKAFKAKQRANIWLKRPLCMLQCLVVTVDMGNKRSLITISSYAGFEI